MTGEVGAGDSARPQQGTERGYRLKGEIDHYAGRRGMAA
jgi:hypothetical protein